MLTHCTPHLAITDSPCIVAHIPITSIVQNAKEETLKGSEVLMDAAREQATANRELMNLLPISMSGVVY